jgi:hypothetical protein
MRHRRTRDDNIKMKLKEQSIRLWNEVTFLVQGPVAGYRVHDNDSSYFIKHKEFLDIVNDHQLAKFQSSGTV